MDASFESIGTHTADGRSEKAFRPRAVCNSRRIVDFMEGRAVRYIQYLLHTDWSRHGVGDGTKVLEKQSGSHAGWKVPL